MGSRPTPAFERYIGIDYSGAKTPTSSLPGLRAYLATRSKPAVQVLPPAGLRRHWTRRGLAEWLVERLSERQPTIVGIDHGFSFPLQYFEHHRLRRNWPAFLDDFRRHWPTDEDDTWVEFVRKGRCGKGAARCGDAQWRRITELRACASKSVFLFDVQGSVAKSTHAGLPWLRVIRRELGARVHFWPFDGWRIPRGRSAIAEVYPALWSTAFPKDGRSSDEHDAWSVARWLRAADRDGTLRRFQIPILTPEQRRIAEIEGWILGVG